MAVKAGRKAVLKIAGTPIGFSNELMKTTDGRTFTIVDKFKHIWDYSSPITISVDAEVVQSGFQIYRAEGKVVFQSVQPIDTVVSVTGKYVLTSKVAHVNSLSFTLEKEVHDVTGFTDEYNRSVVGSRTGSGSFSSWDVTNDALLKQVEADYMLMEIFNDYVEETGRIVSWVTVSSHSLNANVTEMQNREISFNTTGAFTF